METAPNSASNTTAPPLFASPRVDEMSLPLKPFFV
jgi:hypothetical protein